LEKGYFLHFYSFHYILLHLYITFDETMQPTKKSFYSIGISYSIDKLDVLSQLFSTFSNTFLQIACFITHKISEKDLKALYQHIAQITQETTWQVITPQQNEVVQANKIYIAPPNSQISIENGLVVIEKSSQKDNLTNNLFQSLAKEYNQHSIAICMTLPSSQDLNGLYEIKEQGGYNLIHQNLLNPLLVSLSHNHFDDTTLCTQLQDYLTTHKQGFNALTQNKKINYFDESRSQAIFEVMQEGVVIHDMTGAIISCNPSAEKILGLSYEEMIGRKSIVDSWKAIKEDGSPLAGEEHPAMVTVKTGKPQTNVIMGVHKPTGELTWVAGSSNFLYNSSTKQPYAVFSTFYDITKQRQTEESLKEKVLESQKTSELILHQNEELASSEEELRANIEEMVAARDKLQLSEYKLRAIADSTTDVNILISPEKAVLFFNKAAKIYLKKLFNKEIFEGVTIYDFILAAHKADFNQHFSQALLGEGILVEKELTFDTGIKIWFEMQYFPAYDTNNKIIGVSFNANNIDSRKKVEKKIEENAAHLRFLLNNMPIGIYTTDANGYIDFFNEAATQAWGRTPELGKEKWCGSFKIIDENGKLIPHDQCPMAVAIQKNMKISNAEASLETPKGERFTFLASATPFNDTEGKVTGGMNVMVNITEVKEITKRLKENEGFLKTLINNLPGYVYRAENNDKYNAIYVSSQIESITEYSVEEYLTAQTITCLQTLHPDDVGNVLEIVQEAIYLKTSFEFECRLITKKGKIKWIWERGHAIYDDKGNPLYLEGFVVDITERKKIETALAIEKTKFQAIVDSTDGIVWEVDFSTFQFTYVSQKALRLLGFEVEEWYQPNFWVTHMHPDDKSWALDYYVNKIHALENHEFEYRFIAKDGREVWLRDIVTIVSEDHKPTWLRGIMIDITKEKVVAQEKEELLERFEKIAANVQGVFYQYHEKIDGNINFPLVAGQVEAMYGYTASQIQENAMLAFNFVHPDDVQMLIKTRKESAKNLSKWSVTYRIKQPQKEIIWVESNATPKKLVDGSVMWYGYTNNITERKKMEDELHRLSLVAQRTSNAVIITDIKRRILWVNDGFTRITGYTAKEVFGKTPKMLQFEETDKETVKAISKKLNKIQSVRAELQNKAKDGTKYWLDIEIQPLIDTQGILTGFMAIQTDITARKNAETEILKQNEKLKEIAFFQSHILRRPVANILGLINLIEMEKNKPDNLPTLYEYLAYLNEAAQNIDTAIHQIVDEVTQIDEELGE
jgi:PAS domain S-box-containing protein